MTSSIQNDCVKKRIRITIKKIVSTDHDPVHAPGPANRTFIKSSQKKVSHHQLLFGEDLMFQPKIPSELLCHDYPKTFPKVQMEYADSSDLAPTPTGTGRKTSTPFAFSKSSRLSENFEQLSPIDVANGVWNLSPERSSPMKLGKPLLSSTKIHGKMDNDRLTNATRLYKDRLRGISLTSEECELLTSQLLHKNAMLDTFDFPVVEKEVDRKESVGNVPSIWNPKKRKLGVDI